MLRSSDRHKEEQHSDAHIPTLVFRQEWKGMTVSGKCFRFCWRENAAGRVLTFEVVHHTFVIRSTAAPRHDDQVSMFTCNKKEVVWLVGLVREVVYALVEKETRKKDLCCCGCVERMNE